MMCVDVRWCRSYRLIGLLFVLEVRFVCSFKVLNRDIRFSFSHIGDLRPNICVSVEKNL